MLSFAAMDANATTATNDAMSRTRSPLEAWQLVGNTPLLKLRNITAEAGDVEIYAKAEWFNPGGSVKDRPALNMILDGERSGLLTPGKIILDATSGNTGIAYAWIGAARGYKVKLALPQNASEERKRILRSYGAELVLTSPLEGSDGAIREARTTLRRKSRSLLLRRSVQQSGELAGALQHDRARDLGTDCGADHSLHCGPWHQRDVCGHQPQVERTEPEHHGDIISARLTVSRARGVEAHGDSDCAGHLRFGAC